VPQNANNFVAVKDRIYASRDTGELFLDVFHPRTMDRPCPFVIRMSGGGWRTGGKKGTFGRLEWLLPYGIAVVAVEHRNAAAVLWPGQLEDCLQAVDYLHSHAEELRIDSDRMGFIGDSTGGHILAMTAAMLSSPEAAGPAKPPRGMCALFTPSDLRDIRTPEPYVDELLGLPANENESIVRAASPLFSVHPNLPPHLLMHGALDERIPIEQSREWHRKLCEAGVESTLYEYPEVGHETDPFYGRDVSRRRILSFFEGVWDSNSG